MEPFYQGKHEKAIDLLPNSICSLKFALFGIFDAKFFDHVFTHALKIFHQICQKIAKFIKQSELPKRSDEKKESFHQN